jgi:hypothetical protein
MPARIAAGSGIPGPASYKPGLIRCGMPAEREGGKNQKEADRDHEQAIMIIFSAKSSFQESHANETIAGR